MAAMPRQSVDSWDAMLETPAQQRARNLKARDAAKPKTERFAPAGHICGLCDKPALALIAMQRFDKRGTVSACSACVRELVNG